MLVFIGGAEGVRTLVLSIDRASGISARKDILFEEFLIEYFFPFAEKAHSKVSFDKAVYVANAALKFFRGRKLTQIKAIDIERFKASRFETLTMHDKPRKPATVARELSIISKIFSLAVKNDFLESNPCQRVDKPKFDNVQNRVLLPKDEEKFFASFCSDWARDVCILVLNTGLRQNDALGLKKFNVDWNARVIRLIQGKTGRKVEIPMNETVQKLLGDRWNNGSELLFPSPKKGEQGTSVKKAVIGAARRAKIGHLSIRDLRRTFGTRLCEMNFSSGITAQLLGHGDMRSVHRYERAKDILREAVERLDGTNRAKIVPLPQKRKAAKAASR
jgi:integrase